MFDPEALDGSGVPMRDREALIDGLGLGELAGQRRAPLLAEIVRLSKVSVLKSETPTPTER